MSGRIGLFAYGSLVDPESAALTLRRPLAEPMPARLEGWRRRFSQARDNRAAEKTFATPSGEIPPAVLGLNLEPAPDLPAPPPNGVLIEVSEADLLALDVRELRYQRAEIGAAVRGEAAAAFARIVTYVAKPEHLAPAPPEGAVIIEAYARTVEAAFAKLGPDHAELYRRTTLPYPAPVVPGILVEDNIPDGNPRGW